jgi:hypothetical protein
LYKSSLSQNIVIIIAFYWYKFMKQKTLFVLIGEKTGSRAACHQTMSRFDDYRFSSVDWIASQS